MHRPPPPLPPNGKVPDFWLAGWLCGWLAAGWLGGWLALAEIGDVLQGFVQMVGSLWLVTCWLHLHARHMVVTGKSFFYLLQAVIVWVVAEHPGADHPTQPQPTHSPQDPHGGRDG